MKTNRFTEALAAWAANTDWNPSHSASDVTLQKVYVDGTAPIEHSDCTIASDEWTDDALLGAYAITCLNWHDHGSGADYWREITDADIYSNTGAHTWSFGTTPSFFPSWRGVITHELGHAAALEGVRGLCTPGTAIETMCEEGDDADTWQLYSLTGDDKTSANVLYQ